MKTVSITQFPLPEGLTLEALSQGFEEVAPNLAQVPGLVHKSFLVSQDLRRAGGSYLWESEEQARSFSEHMLRDLIRHRFGVECTIEYFHAPVLVEGRNADVETQ
jgi:hypothetical protein